MSTEDNKEMSAALQREIELLTQEIDFAQLEKDGLLKNVDGEYICQNVSNLPRHVRKQIKSNIKTEFGALLTFFKTKKNKL